MREISAGNKQIIAYVVKKQETIDLSEKDLRNNLKKHLSQYLLEYMIPTFIIFIEALPLTVNGKIDRNALPSPSDMIIKEDVKEARSATEKEIINYTQNLLGIEPIGVNECLLTLGLNSINSIAFAKYLSDLFCLPVTSALFEKYNSVEELSKVLSSKNFKTEIFTCIKETGSEAPLFLCHPIQGFASPYKELSNLNLNFPIYGFNDPKFYSNNKYTTLEEMASDYIVELKKTLAKPLSFGWLVFWWNTRI